MKTVLVSFCIVSCSVFTPLLYSPTTAAEQIIIPIGQQGQTAKKPKLGQSKRSVLAEFGEPIKQFPAVGQPPISRWEYQYYTVYFESNHVIHAVIKHKASTK